MHVLDAIRVPRTAILVGLLMFGLSFAFAQPSPRAYTDMAYDSQSGLFVLFGGQTGYYLDPSQFAGDTWVFDPVAGTWDQRAPAVSPPAGVGFNLAYDEESDRVVLWGGGSAFLEPLTDVWSYDTEADVWTRLDVTSDSSPGGRIGSVMVYDSESDRFVMFGGYSQIDGAMLNDTWSLDLDARSWTRHETDPTPSARNFHQMTYDATTDRVYLWGGDSFSLRDKGAMWSFDVDEGAWTMLEPVEEPEARDYGGLVSLPDAGRLLLYGGGRNGSDATWLFDPVATTWSKVDDPGPGVRSRFAMAGGASGAVVFGGQRQTNQYEYEDDTWWFDGAVMEWSQP